MIRIISIILALLLCGCGRGSQLQTQEEEEGMVIARIDRYKMTVADFRDRVNLILASKYLAVEPNEAKEELLDELITRNILVQEAQKRNLDKQRAFMREIEQYWEQSLLKLLLRRQEEEIAGQIRIEDCEIISEYNNMKRKIFAELIVLDNQAAAEELSKTPFARFEQVKDDLSEQIISEDLPQWRVLGDLPRYLEEPLFSLKAGDISSPIKCGTNWAVLKLIREDNIQIEPYERLKMEIGKRIERRKKDEMLEDWIKKLRSGASIEINRDALKLINLE